MAILQYNEIVQRKYIDLDGEPWEVISSQVSRKQANKPVNKTKIKSFISGKTIEKVFHSSDKAQEAELEKIESKYLYSNKGEYWFCDPSNPSDRYSLSANILGAPMRFVKENQVIKALTYKEKIIGVQIPVKADLIVTEAPPAVKGNTATGADKVITLETGATVTAPIFVADNDVVRVNTQEGTYVERVTKA